MSVALTGAVVADGCVELAWQPGAAAHSATLLIIRTGAVPAFTALRLAGDLTAYRIQNLSRHQRYRMAVLCAWDGGATQSRWLEVTPRAGLEVVDGETTPEAAHVARVDRVMVMPQDRRLVVYWSLTPGFADSVLLQVSKDGQPWHRLELEPEVASVALDRRRGAPLENGVAYAVQIAVTFAGATGTTIPIACTPAAPGEERRANQPHPQGHLLYPQLAVAPEVRPFLDEDPGAADPGPARITCCHCRREVQWAGERLRCSGCRAEFIPNGRGDYLDAARLRFGTCRCCVPHKILVRKGEALLCAHSAKEHIRGGSGFLLIEDLPHGLCQCCRPRRPLEQQSGAIVCVKTNERHRNEHGRYVLVPSQPVFDAKEIDDLLDAGFAEICATGINRGGKR